MSKKKTRKDFSFSRFFNPSKSPHYGSIGIGGSGNFYFPVHMKRQGILVWPSATKGTYVRKIHGPLEFSKR